VTLLACPFCRELYSKDEAEVCPHCELGVVPLESLGPSADALAELPELGPEDRPLPWHSLGAFRGLSLAGALLGLYAFCTPWFELAHPEDIGLSGLDLAKGNAPWLWGGAIGFFLLIPLLASRRTLNELSRIRVIATTFAVMTACEVVVLALKPPLEASYFRAELSYLPGFYASGALSLVTAIACVWLGRVPASLRPGAASAAARAQLGDPRARANPARAGTRDTLH
jgi:hypothetical protein